MINFEELIKNIKTDWKLVLKIIYKKQKTKMIKLKENIEEMCQKYDEHFETFPPSNLIFNAFNYFNFEDLKIVIIGQDPYHGEGQAMGLSFSVQDGIKIPPSLLNIYKELKLEYEDYEIPKTGNLDKWANQGVLLLNATLTVREGKANSHELFWKETEFTDNIIEYISINHQNVIFMLWGNFAKKKKKLIDTKNHFVLESSHPSPLSRTGWFGCNHFKKANQILTENEMDEIDWQI